MQSIVNDSAVEQNFVSLADQTSSGDFSFHDAIDEFGTISGTVTFTQHPFNAGDAFPPNVTFTMKGRVMALFTTWERVSQGGVGGRTDFWYAGASAEQSTIINEGGTVAGAGGGATQFVLNTPTAAPGDTHRQWRH